MDANEEAEFIEKLGIKVDLPEGTESIVDLDIYEKLVQLRILIDKDLISYRDLMSSYNNLDELDVEVTRILLQDDIEKVYNEMLLFTYFIEGHQDTVNKIRAMIDSDKDRFSANPLLYFKLKY